MSTSLDGHVALVTGAGRGIGRAHALQMASRGTKVVACDIGVALDGSGADVTVANEVAAEITAAGGVAVPDTNDISRFSGGAAAVWTGIEAFGKVDIVVNNAGLVGAASIEDITEEILDHQFAVHVYGAVGTVKAAWPGMRAQSWGRVINTVSEAAFPPKVPRGRGGLGYGMAKAAIWTATFALAAEGLPHGITVNAISPACSHA